MLQTRLVFLFCLLVFVATIIGCGGKRAGNATKTWQNIEVRVDTLLTLGEDTTSFLIFPEYIAIDSEDRILVGDPGQNKVLAYSQDGEFLYTIGNKGRGPAEFEEMAGLSIDSEDIVTVFDRSAQLLKTFNSTGEFIKTIDLGKMVDSRIKFGKWKQYTLMSYILLRGDSNVLDQDYLHIYNQYNQVGSGVTPRDFKNLDKNYVKILSQFQGSIFIYEDTFYFVPYAYNGDIYKYQLSENTTTVQVAYDGIIEGYTHNPKRTRHITSTTEPVFWDAMRTGYGTTDYFVVYNQSLGLFKLKDGNIAHFTYIESTDGKQRTFGAELYDSTLQPIGYAPIITTPWGSKSSENYIRPWHFKWKDEEDRFYVVHLELGKPIQVHVVKFNFQMD